MSWKCLNIYWQQQKKDLMWSFLLSSICWGNEEQWAALIDYSTGYMSETQQRGSWEGKLFYAGKGEQLSWTNICTRLVCSWQNQKIQRFIANLIKWKQALIRRRLLYRFAHTSLLDICNLILFCFNGKLSCRVSWKG